MYEKSVGFLNYVNNDDTSFEIYQYESQLSIARLMASYEYNGEKKPLIKWRRLEHTRVIWYRKVKY